MKGYWRKIMKKKKVEEGAEKKLKDRRRKAVAVLGERYVHVGAPNLCYGHRLLGIRQDTKINASF